jgi:lipopolysaccharide biosynthesis regulator YciM
MCAADVELAKSIIQGYTKRLSRYRCDNCGFKARQFYWRCPGLWWLGNLFATATQ